jgi:hypothetical protein
MDNPEKMAGYTRRRGNQRWTIQRKWQGTQDEDKQNKNNPQKLVTLGTEDEDKQNKNNPKKLAT